MKKITAQERALRLDFLKIPYLHGGRSFAGADCWGGIILWYWHFLHIVIMDIDEEYTPDWKFKGKNYFIENYQKQWDKISDTRKHDVVLFKNEAGVVYHAGVYLGDGQFYNIVRAGGAICRLDTSGWKERVEGFYRFKGLDENNN
jgi:cell wall-associated NlpC family hydrolase